MKYRFIGLIMLALSISGCPRKEFVLSFDRPMYPPQEELLKELKAASLREDNYAVAKLIIALGLTAEFTPEVWNAVVEAVRTNAPVPSGVDWPDGLPYMWATRTGEIALGTPPRSICMRTLAREALSRMEQRVTGVFVEEVDEYDKISYLTSPRGWATVWADTDTDPQECSEPALPPENSIRK